VRVVDSFQVFLLRAFAEMQGVVVSGSSIVSNCVVVPVSLQGIGTFAKSPFSSSSCSFSRVAELSVQVWNSDRAARFSGSGRGRGIGVFAEMAPAAAVAEQEPEAFGVSMYPMHRSKVIHIVRHGQGYHNVAGELDHANYMSWEYADASLTDLGWLQAEVLHEHVDATGIKAQVELVVVSPLMRTLQTAAGVWGGATLAEEGAAEGKKLLMVSGLGKAPHPAIAPANSLKFVANEWCREQNGMHPCDRRSSVTFYKKSFPYVDFSEVGTDEDTWWSETKRETVQELFTRARTFVRWLLDRPESRIAVVSHSSFIFHMCHLFGADCSDVVRKEIQQGFRNCEMRTVVISDRLATGPAKAASTDFAGGLHYNDASSVSVREAAAEAKGVPQANSLATEEQAGPSYDAQGEEIETHASS
jgi:broad specificity phosphatase PhoE